MLQHWIRNLYTFFVLLFCLEVFFFNAKSVSAAFSHVKRSKKDKKKILLLLLLLFGVFSRNWPPCNVTGSADTSVPPSGSLSLHPFNIHKVQQRKAQGYNQAIGRCEQESSECSHGGFFFSSNQFSCDWMFHWGLK